MPSRSCAAVARCRLRTTSRADRVGSGESAVIGVPFDSPGGAGIFRYSVLYLIRRILVTDRPVKRNYEAGRRRERAAERRAEVVRTAWGLFASLGYGLTTV